VGCFSEGARLPRGRVSPDASTGHPVSTANGTGTLAEKLSGCKEGMAHSLQVQLQIFWVLRVSRYKFYCEQGTSQGTQRFIESRCAVTIYHVLQSCLNIWIPKPKMWQTY